MDIPVEACEDDLAKADTSLMHVEFTDAQSELLGKLTAAERELFRERYENGLTYHKFENDKRMILCLDKPHPSRYNDGNQSCSYRGDQPP